MEKANPAPLEAAVRPLAWIRLCSDGCYEGPIADCDKRMDAARRASGAWTPLYAIPEGWQLAPKEPTLDQCFAGANAPAEDCDYSIPAIYKAMLEAAPNADGKRTRSSRVPLELIVGQQLPRIPRWLSCKGFVDN